MKPTNHDYLDLLFMSIHFKDIGNDVIDAYEHFEKVIYEYESMKGDYMSYEDLKAYYEEQIEIKNKIIEKLIEGR